MHRSTRVMRAASVALATAFLATSSAVRADEPTKRGVDVPDFAVGVESTPGYAGVFVDYFAIELAAGAAWNATGRSPYVSAGLHVDLLGFADAELTHWFNPFVGIGYRWERRNEGFADFGLEIGLSPTRLHPVLRVAYRLGFGHGAEHLLLVGVGARIRVALPHGPVWQPRRLRDRAR